MGTISKKQFRELAAVEEAFCVSIYLPVHRAGMEVINREDKLFFKNQLKNISEELVRHGMLDTEVDLFLQPAWNLYEDPGFWRYQKEGLAVFLAKDLLQYFTLPFEPRPYTYVSHEFYLKPLLPAFAGDGHFYLLGLNLHHVALYEGDRQELKEIYIKEHTPQRLEEVVGTDYKERFQHVRTQREGYGYGAVIHGHGEWKGEFRKEEILHFFRAIDKSIAPYLAVEHSPLIFAGVDYLFPIYQEANTYPNLLEEHIGLNPEYMDMNALHREAWPNVYDYFDRERVERIEQYGHLIETERTSFAIEEIVPAAVAGRIDALFIDEKTDIWGIYDPGSGRVEVHEGQKPINTELINLAAKEVLINRGRVYVQARETLPQSFSPANALFRY